MAFTGGGTAGHVLPNIAVIEELRERCVGGRLDILYVGGVTGPERELCAKYGVPFVGVATGKLRRYFSWENFVDPFRVVVGAWEAWRALRAFRPDVVFSKGGFVSVPVVMAAARLGVPVVLHEADVEPGLANKMCMRFAKVVCVSWEKSMTLVSGMLAGNTAKRRTLWTGMPVRREVLSGVRERGLEFLGFDGKKPVLLVMGGSLGAASVNRLVWAELEELLEVYDVVHVTGRDAFEGSELMMADGMIPEAVEQAMKSRRHYRVFPYLQDELFDVYACADVVVSRAGASALAELSVLGKPSVLIPLGSTQSRGDQIVNAGVLREAGACEVYFQDWNEPSKFLEKVIDLGTNDRRRAEMSDAMQVFGERHRRAAGQIAEVILSVVT